MALCFTCINKVYLTWSQGSSYTRDELGSRTFFAASATLHQLLESQHKHAAGLSMEAPPTYLLVGHLAGRFSHSPASSL